MMRVSPRQVRLKGEERQKIRLMLRRPRDLAPGEYRSQLFVKAITPERNANDSPKDSLIMSLNIRLSFSGPVIVQQGELDFKIGLKKVDFQYDPIQNSGKVIIDIDRTGRNSTFGIIKAYWTPENGKEEMIAALGDYNSWLELKHNRLSLAWADKLFKPDNGALRVLYQGKK
jgi:hypothetical protein